MEAASTQRIRNSIRIREIELEIDILRQKRCEMAMKIFSLKEEADELEQENEE